MALHRSEQILDAVVAILKAADIEAGKHRVVPYPDAAQPAISVRFGPDGPPEASNIPVIDSVLTVSLVASAKGATEAEAVASLLDLRSRSHIALMADRQLGLASFVSDCRYGGASPPELEATSEYIAGYQETTWLVPYRMNLADPTQ